MKKTLPKKSFAAWVKKLKDYRLYAPVLQGEVWSYEPADDMRELDGRFTHAVQAPKKMVFPQQAILMEFGADDEGKPTVTERLPENEPTVVLGVRPCDARGMTRMDKVFGGEFRDPYYWAGREGTVLVGLACGTPPSTNCFCQSVGGSPHSTEGLDVLLTDLGDRYFVEAFTGAGEALLKAGGAAFGKASSADQKASETVHADAEERMPRAVEGVEEVPGKLAQMFDSPFWDQEAMSCIRCGICTFLCPTCHCFDISDEVTSAAPATGVRVRTWDNCQFPDFTMHSSGHNPRPDKASRLRQRINHKFQYFHEHHGEYQCVGCGRCVSHCPVSIDIIDILNEVPGHEL